MTMREERERVREDLLAVLAASRELTADHDEALADLILDRVTRPAPRTKQRTTTPRRNLARTNPTPILVTLGIATVLSLTAALPAGASADDFLMVWFFVVCLVAVLMQVGLYISADRISGRTRRT